MRQDHHVDAGNPTQHHLLPNNRPALDHATAFAKWRRALSATTYILATPIILSIAALFSSKLLDPSVLESIPPNGFITMNALAICVILTLCALISREYARICSLLPCPRLRAYSFRDNHGANVAITSMLIAITATFFIAYWDFPVDGVMACGGLGVLLLIERPRTILEAVRHFVRYRVEGPQPPGAYYSPISPDMRSGSFFMLTMIAILLLTPDALRRSELIPSQAVVFFSTVVTALTFTCGQPAKWRERWKDHIDSDVTTAMSRHIRLANFASDGAPVYATDGQRDEPVLIEGRNGTGKTIKAIRELIFASVLDLRRSTMIQDLKADTNDLPAIALEAHEELFKRTGVRKPVYLFTLEMGKACHGFNLFDQTFFKEKPPQQKAEFLANVGGMVKEGSTGNEAYFQEQDLYTMAHVMEAFRGIQSYEEMAEYLEHLTRLPGNRGGLHETQKRSAQMAVATSRRLAGFTALARSDIDMEKIVTESSIIIVMVSSLKFHVTSGTTARMFMWSAVDALAVTPPERRIKIDCIVDEATSALAHNTNDLFRKARSVGMPITVAFQAIEDLDESIARAVETNCGIQWRLSVSNPSSILKLSQASGTEIDFKRTRTVNHEGHASHSTSESLAPRLSVNDIRRASADPNKSIMQFLKNDGYSVTGGMPFIADTPFKTTREYAESLHNFPWPVLPGTTVNGLPGQRRSSSTRPQHDAPESPKKPAQSEPKPEPESAKTTPTDISADVHRDPTTGAIPLPPPASPPTPAADEPTILTTRGKSRNKGRGRRGKSDPTNP